MKRGIHLTAIVLLFAHCMTTIPAKAQSSDIDPTPNNTAYSFGNLYADSVLNVVQTLNMVDYTIPSWTRLCKARKNHLNMMDSISAQTLLLEKSRLIQKESPYNVCMTINGDPRTRMGFTWFTNLGIQPGSVQIVKGKTRNAHSFENPTFTFSADTVNLWNLNYCSENNDLYYIADIFINSKRNYTSHKALATNLEPNTCYSYRVGYEGHWSTVGDFTTAPNPGESFSFLYITDTQSDSDEGFSFAEKTLSAAKSLFPYARFCTINGDLVQSPGLFNSEWEWEHFFESMQNVWNSLPSVPIAAGHDQSVNRNFTHHFNTEKVSFDQEMSITPGSVYSFVYGDALFIATSLEESGMPGYLDSVRHFIRASVEAHPLVKWKIALIHRNIYTGSYHQDDAEQKIFRDTLAPVYDEVGMDLVLQGHDHLYEVIGPVHNKSLVENSVSEVRTVPGDVRNNVKGKEGGVFNIQKGTLYFLNNSAGMKKYEPLTQVEMDEGFSYHLVPNYWSLFTGKYGQSGDPTFSNLEVTKDTLFVTTYKVDFKRVTTLFDAFKVVKSADNTLESSPNKGMDVTVFSNPGSATLTVDGIPETKQMNLYNTSGRIVSSAKNTNILNVAFLPDGFYILKVFSGEHLFTTKVQIRR